MKSIEAINAIIILVLGVLVILAVLGLFMGVWSPAKSGTSLQVATKSACSRVIAMGEAACKDCWTTGNIVIDGFDANKDGKINPGVKDSAGELMDNLRSLCINYYGAGSNSCDGDMSDPPACPNCCEQCVIDCLQKVCGCSAYS
jgi:hypothetical protein